MRVPMEPISFDSTPYRPTYRGDRLSPLLAQNAGLTRRWYGHHPFTKILAGTLIIACCTWNKLLSFGATLTQRNSVTGTSLPSVQWAGSGLLQIIDAWEYLSLPAQPIYGKHRSLMLFSVATSIAALFFIIVLLWGVRGHWRNRDFCQWYLCGLALKDNPSTLYSADLNVLANSFGMELTSKENKGVNYPPTAVIFFEQLTWVSPQFAFRVFQVLEFVSLVLIIWLLVWDNTPTTHLWFKFFLSSLIAFFYPISEQMHQGVISIFLLVLLVLMMRSLRSGQDLLAGITLALACLIKLFPGLLLIYLIVCKKWRVLNWSIVFIVLGSALTVSVVGLHSTLAFVTKLGYLNTMNGPFSVKAFVLHLFRLAFGLPLGAGKFLAYEIVTALTELALVALAIKATLESAHDLKGQQYSFGMWLVIMVLMSPPAWAHYGVLFLPTLAQIAFAAYARAVPLLTVTLGIASYVFANLTGLLFVLSINASIIPILRHTEFDWSRMQGVYGLFFVCGVLVLATAYRLCVDRRSPAISARVV